MTIAGLKQGIHQRRKPQQREAQLQSECVRWFRLQYPKSVIFAVPNGGSRNAIEAARLKQQGVTAGVADLIVMHPFGRILFVEMKQGKGTQTVHQKQFAERCEALGYKYSVCRNINEFIEAAEAN